MSADYELFVPLDENYIIDDPRYAHDPLTRLSLAFQLYGAVPLGSTNTDAPDIVEEKRFCFLGKAYNQCYIELCTVTSRLKREAREKDYVALYNNPHARLFDVWDRKADRTVIPPYMLVNARLFSFEAWDKIQLNRWSELCVVISNARPVLPFNVYSRFIEPAADQISLFFTPSSYVPAVFTVNLLKKVFKASHGNHNFPEAR